MNKCLGCGAILQSKDISKEGYTFDLNKKYCKRCFDITHYNKYIFSSKGNEEYLEKIDLINKTNDLVILTVSLFEMTDFNLLNIKNPVILVFTKRDLIPRSINEGKILDSINCNLNVKGKLFISSKNNYNLDFLMDLINKYKVSKNVYIVGLTNAGKSSLINKIVKNYSDGESDITVSNIPSTTLDFIEKKVKDDLVLIDTPGLLDDGNIINILPDYIKKIVPNREVNPIIYQIKCSQSIFIEDFFRIDFSDKNNVIFYISNSLKINRIFKDTDKLSHLKKYNIDLSDNQDIVIKGLGFIKVKNKCNINLYLLDGVKYFIRNSII
ncbi:MAG: 50S ribosome-binding GTPase [Bacilli bacterium]|nr:50S ribosome-binding GTPase [Bacilli bacterium]